MKSLKSLDKQNNGQIINDHYLSLTSLHILKTQNQQPHHSQLAKTILHYLINIQPFPQKFLFNHSITQFMRNRMLDWMIQVIFSYKCQVKTYFRAVCIMDNYFRKCKEQIVPTDLHLIGVASMFMSCKFEQIHPIKLKTFYEKISHKKLSCQLIKQKECEILLKLDYQILSTTLLQIIQAILSIMSVPNKSYLKDICIYIAKMVLFDYQMLSTNRLDALAISIVRIASRKMKGNFLVEVVELQRAKKISDQQQITFRKRFPNIVNLQKFNNNIRLFI